MTTLEPTGPGAPGAAAPAPSPPKPVRDVLHGARWTIRLVLVSVFVPLVFALAAPFLLIGQEITAPSWVRERVEQAASDALGGGALRFEAITVRVPADLHPEVRMLGVTLLDREGRQVARVPEVRAQVSPRGLLFERQLLVQRIALSGAELSLARAADGSVDLAFGGGGAASAGNVAGLASIPERFESLFELSALAALRAVEVDGLVVNYEDARAGRSWTLDGGRLGLDLSGGMTRLTGEISVLSGRDFVTRATLVYESPRADPSAKIAVTLTDVAAADVASQGAALTWLRVVDAPISMALRMELDGTGTLGPTSVALKIAEGELRPTAGAAPVGFDHASAYLSYDPAGQSVRFDRVEVHSDWGSVRGEGRAYLREIEAGLPRALLGQFTLRDIALSPPGVFEEPAVLPEATAQFRLRLDPFTMDLAEASLALPGEGGGQLALRGRIGASPEGWEVAMDGRLGQATRDRILVLWPERFRPGLREWIVDNLTAGTLRDTAAAFRLRPGEGPAFALTSHFDGLAVKPLWTHPPITGGAGRITWEGGTFTAALDRGILALPSGGQLELGGTAISIFPGNPLRSPAQVTVDARGSIAAALAFLDQPAWRFISNAGLSLGVAQGRIEAKGTVDLFVGPMTPDELRYDIAGTAHDVESDQLIPGHVLTAEMLTVAATPAGVEIGGEARVGTARVEGAWRQAFAAEAWGRSTVEAEIQITPATLQEFGIALPEGSVSGEGRGYLTVAFAPDAAPAYEFTSDLAGLRIQLPEIGWAKGAGRTGELLVEGRLGTPVTVDRLRLSAAGLTGEGDVRLTADGSFDRLRLTRLQIGDWLDAAVTLTARAGHDMPAIAVNGGKLDLVRAAFGSGGGGEGGPITVVLDTLQVTSSIALTDFTGEFSTVAGLEGGFSGFVNGGPPVTGRVAPQQGRVAARIQGQDAGAVMRAANLFTRAEGGALDLLLTPMGEASYAGELWVTGLRVQEAPVLASLLNAASVVGLLQQLGGQGIVFDEVSADFRIDPDKVIVGRSSAIGAGLGLSASGVFDTEAYWMDFEGVVSPLYLLNGIGSILTRPGEGLLGFNFTLRGDPDNPSVGVNPVSVLAPGMLREIFRGRTIRTGP